MYKRMLVPVDGSDVGETVLPFVLELAGRLDLEVILLEVNRPIPPMAIEGSRAFTLDDVEMRRNETDAYLTAASPSRRSLRPRATSAPTSSR